MNDIGQYFSYLIVSYLCAQLIARYQKLINTNSFKMTMMLTKRRFISVLCNVIFGTDNVNYIPFISGIFIGAFIIFDTIGTEKDDKYEKIKKEMEEYKLKSVEKEKILNENNNDKQNSDEKKHIIQSGLKTSTKLQLEAKKDN